MVTDGIKQVLIDEIEEAKECYANTPPNEASTCNWVILPLLNAVGYANKEIIAQAGNPGNGYPDYTILPNTPHTWYLEAKDWKKSLDNGPEATQALNYANAHGHRWVVLSNGQEWLLFDNHIQGVQADKRLVARTDLKDPSFVDFMMALNKASVESGGLEKFASMWSLRALLRQQLLVQDSKVIKAILKVIGSEPGLSSVQPADLVLYFKEISGEALAENAVTSIDKVPKPTDGTADALNLTELLHLGSDLWGNMPMGLSMPDGKTLPVNSWRKVAGEVVTWIAGKSGLPALPFQGSQSAKRWFLNTEPIHADGTAMVYWSLDIDSEVVFMDVNYNASDFMKRLAELCNVTKTMPTGFSVMLKK